jgi:hypothetical protein
VCKTPRVAHRSVEEPARFGILDVTQIFNEDELVRLRCVNNNVALASLFERYADGDVSLKKSPR